VPVVAAKNRSQKEKKQFSEERIRSLANDLQPFLSVKGWKVAEDVVQFEGSLRTDPANALKAINNTLRARKRSFEGRQ
jgi:hypothetical protein